MTRVAVLQDPTQGGGSSAFAIIQASAPHEVFVQERDGEFIELASRADGPAGTARISDLERTRIGFPERCHGLLQALRFSDLGRFETAAGLIMRLEFG